MNMHSLHDLSHPTECLWALCNKDICQRIQKWELFGVSYLQDDVSSLYNRSAFELSVFKLSYKINLRQKVEEIA